MKQAIVAVEDRRFFEHRGVDIRGIARAVWQDLRNRAVVEGGSTITQQFVKNAYVKSSRSFERKLKEAALAWQLEQQWPKDRILTAYLNTIYFGNGAYGIEQASRVYFRHKASSLSLARIGAPGRDTGRSGALRPGAEPAPGEGASPHGAAGDARAGRHHARRVLARRPRAAARAGPRPTARHPGACPVLHELREAAARRRVRHGTRVRRRLAGADVHRPRRYSSSPEERSRSGSPTTKGRPAALVASTRATGACSRCTAAGASHARASSTSRSRESNLPERAGARRSSPSPFGGKRQPSVRVQAVRPAAALAGHLSDDVVRLAR